MNGLSSAAGRQLSSGRDQSDQIDHPLTIRDFVFCVRRGMTPTHTQNGFLQTQNRGTFGLFGHEETEQPIKNRAKYKGETR